MITSMRLDHFKAFRGCELRLKHVNIILGPNNSGKSSLTGALKLLAQTVASNDPEVPLLLNGPLGDFGTFKDIVHGNFGGTPMGVALSVPGPQPKSVPGPEQDYHLNLTYKYRAGRRELILREAKLSYGYVPLLSTNYSSDSGKQLVESIRGRSIPPAQKSAISQGLRVMNFVPILGVLSARGTEGAFLKNAGLRSPIATVDDIRRAGWLIFAALRTVEYLGARRLPPERTYLFTGERRHRIGPAGEHAASIFALAPARVGKRPELEELVSNWLSKAGIASHIRVKPLSDRHYELRVQHPQTKEVENIADVGYGNSQVFPVLVGGYFLASGSTYIVEEPEIHLHPRAQATLGDFLLDLYERRIQSVVETHSEHLLLRLQQHVADRKLPPDHVGVFYVRAGEDGKTVREMTLDENGAFTEDWPEGFFPERLEEARKLAAIRLKRADGG